MTREKAIRYKIFQLLSGNVTYDSGLVPVDDSVLNEDSNTVYILLTRQTATIKESFHQDSWFCDQEVEIYAKQMQTVSKDVVDDIAEQVETLIYQALRNGAEYEGWQLTNVSLASAENNAFELSPTKSIISKFLTFRLLATKISSY